MLNDDIRAAQQIVSNKFSNINLKVPYHEHSFVYKTTNEKTHCYQYLLNDVNNLLCVVSSGDQILNAVATGVKNIDCYDISVFPKYFLELKIAAIKALTKDEFIDYFFRLKGYLEFSEELYEKIRCNLTTWALKFWDSLYNFYDGYEIYNSTLFSSEPYNIKEQIEKMPYIVHYDDLKNNIKDITLNYHEGNILDILNEIEQQYDLINLSSIIYYEKQMLQNYKDILLSCHNLENRGKVQAYLYKISDANLKELKNHFSEENFSITKCENDAVVVYQKNK